MKTKTKKQTILYVQILEAKPNPMFTENQRQGVRFLKYNQPVACAECGKRLRILWTALWAFRSPRLEGQFVIPNNTQIHPPLTPVCGDHPLSPAWQ
jgi:hypothetical protein